MREVVNGLMYVLSTGCQWRAIPKDLPPKSTVYDYFDLWTYDGTLQRIHYALYDQCREGIAITLPPWMAQASATAAAEQSCAEPIRASVGSPTRRLLSPPSGEYANHRHAVLLAPRQQITLDASAVEAVTDLIGRAPTAVSKTEEIFHIADIEVGDAPSTNLPRGAQGLERRLSVPGEGPRGRPRLGRRGAVYAPSPSRRNVGQFAEVVRTARGEGSRPRHPPVLPERQKCAKIHAGSGFIWRTRLIPLVDVSRLRNTSRAGDLKAGVPTTNSCLASGAALDFVDFGGDLACNWLELGEDA